MIYTGYFARMKNYKGKTASIARFIPPSLKCNMRLNCFYPSVNLLQDYKNGNVTEQEYTKRYRTETLDKIDKEWLRSILYTYEGKDENLYLLCYEKPMDFCHRHLVAQWLREEMNVQCVESKS